MQILAASDPAWLIRAPAGTSNHMIWHAGHALWLQDHLCVELLSGQSELPDHWARRFGMNCEKPMEQTGAWPTQQDMLGLLDRQLARIWELLEQAPNDDLQLSVGGSGTVAGRIIHGFHDEAKHSGEMYLLLKWCRAN